MMNIYTQIFTNKFYYAAAGLSWERPCSDLFGVVQLLLLLDLHFSATKLINTETIWRLAVHVASQVKLEHQKEKDDGLDISCAWILL